MTNNFKPGDLAMVIGVRFPECEPNLGKIVTIVASSFLMSGELWISGDIVNRYGLHLDKLLILPSHLMPLRGDLVPEQAKSREVPA